jgi:hypothetical protein
MRCLKTDNPCGSDTWMWGTSCGCKNCQEWVTSQEPKVGEWCPGCGSYYYVESGHRCYEQDEQGEQK